MDYVISIGRIRNMDTGSYDPVSVFQINEDQRTALLAFADIKRDEYLNELYIINKCQFRIEPKLNTCEKYPHLKTMDNLWVNK